MFVGIFLLIVLVQYLLPKPVNWQRTYSYKDKNPFGAYAIHQLLKPTYGASLKVNKSTLYNLQEDSVKKKTLVAMNDRINLSKTDLKTLFNFISSGHTVFLSANKFNGSLADTFHLNTNSEQYSFYLKPDSLIKTPGVKLKMTASNLKSKEYTYPLLCFDSYFSNYDSTRFTTHSLNNSGKSVLISTTIGKGKLYLMSMPDVFTNFFIVEHNNRSYAYSVLTLATQHADEVIWDEYYKNFNPRNESMFKFIFDSDALYTAYVLTILSLILYMIFDGRRRQRAIPIVEPIKNTTLEFVNVVSHVYFNSDNHQFISEERIRYFYESIRKRFAISTSDINDEFYQQISDLSGYDQKLVKQLFVYCEKLKRSKNTTEYDLIELSRQINNFNKHSLR